MQRNKTIYNNNITVEVVVIVIWEGGCVSVYDKGGDLEFSSSVCPLGNKRKRNKMKKKVKRKQQEKEKIRWSLRRMGRWGILMCFYDLVVVISSQKANVWLLVSASGPCRVRAKSVVSMSNSSSSSNVCHLEDR